MHVALAVVDGPFQGGQQAVVLGDVVGRDSERSVKLLDQIPVQIFDADTVASRPRVAPGAAVDISANHGGANFLARQARIVPQGQRRARPAERRIREQLSHCITL